MKKTLAIIFAVILAFGSCVCAFAEDTYTITFEYSYGNDTKKSFDLVPGADITFPADDEVKVDGYKFAGWYNSDNTRFTETKMPENDVTVGARYYKVFKLSFVTGVDSIKFDDQYLTVADKIEYPNTDISGYKFNGWYLDQDLTEKFDEAYIPERDVTLYGSFEKVTATTYTLTYNFNNVKTNTVIQPAELDAGTKVTVAPAPVSSEATFVAWNTQADGKGKEYMPGSTLEIKQDTVLYAIWTTATPEGTYKLSFVSNEEEKKFDTLTLKAGDEIRLPDTKLANYYFCGWYSDKEMTKEFKETKMPAADTTVYAKYAINLSAFKTVLAELSKSIEKSLADVNFTPDALNTIAKAAGYKFTYKINDKEYEINDLTKISDEIIAALEKETKAGSVNSFTMQFTQNGKPVSDTTTITKFIYNDSTPEEPSTDKKEDPSNEDPTSKNTDPTKKADEPSTTKKADSTTNVPKTGSNAKIAIGAVAAIVIACAAVFVVSKKKKDEDKETAEEN